MEGVAPAVSEVAGMEFLPVEAFLAEMPQACRGRGIPERWAARIERPVLS